MSFSITETGKRADVARSIRQGDHHKKGEHTHLDQAREFIAETVEHTGEEGDTVRLIVAGHHSETGRFLSVSVDIVPSDLPGLTGEEIKGSPTSPGEPETTGL